MKKLKELRERNGYTQAKLAKMIGTTQQTIARWEQGKAEPNLAKMRDLSICLLSSVGELLGEEKVFAKQSVNPFAWCDGDDSGFWGHIGIRLISQEKSKWYPITTKTMKSLYQDVQLDDNDNWVLFQTLNNKFVIFSPERTESIIMLDEADDGVCAVDWDVSPDEQEGWSREIYECLEFLGEYGEGVDHKEERFSALLISGVKKLIKEYDFSEEDIEQMCLVTKVKSTTGGCREVMITKERMSEVFFDFEIGIENTGVKMLVLNDDYGERDIFMSLQSISVIEFPLLKLEEGLGAFKIEA